MENCVYETVYINRQFDEKMFLCTWLMNYTDACQKRKVEPPFMGWKHCTSEHIGITVLPKRVAAKHMPLKLKPELSSSSDEDRSCIIRAPHIHTHLYISQYTYTYIAACGIYMFITGLLHMCLYARSQKTMDVCGKDLHERVLDIGHTYHTICLYATWVTLVLVGYARVQELKLNL